MTDTHENLIRKSQDPQVILEEDENEQTLSPSISREDLTIIKGIGPAAAELLNRGGITSVDQLAKFNVDRLSEIPRIGLAKARKMIEGARSHLATRRLDNFSQTESDIMQPQILQEVEEFEDGEQIEQNELIDKVSEKSIKPWFKDTNDRLPTETWHAPSIKSIPESIEEPIIENFEFEIPEELIENINDISEGEIRDDILEDASVLQRVNPPESMSSELETTHRKVVNHQEIQDLSQKIFSSLKENQFSVIRKTPKLGDLYQGIDILAIKLITIKEKLKVICILPIKISVVNGLLIVSLDKIALNNKKGDVNPAINRKLELYSTSLSDASARVIEDMNNKGSLYSYLKEYLRIDLTVETTRSHKNLYFRSGPVQYKLVVTPVLISQHKVGFTEKILPFAYQKGSDLHVVGMKDLSYFLQYINQKYFYIEKYNKEPSALTLNNEVSAKVMNLLRKSSMIFLSLGMAGIIFLVFALFQGFSNLVVVTNLGYGAVVLYMIFLGYFYLTNNRNKASIHNSFETPYHKRKLNLDEDSRMLIREEIPSKLMEQLAYECLDENNKSKVITSLDFDNTQDFIREKSLKRGVNEEILFEKRDTNKEDPQVEGRQIKNYSSFLED